MPMPKTKGQTFILILISFTFSFIITLIGSFLSEVSLVGEDGTIKWIRIWIPVLVWLLSSLPLLAASLGIPAWGTEQLVYKSKQLGTERTEQLIDVAKQETREIDQQTVKEIVENVDA